MANHNSVRFSVKFCSSKCKQSVCLHYGLDLHSFKMIILYFSTVLLYVKYSFFFEFQYVGWAKAIDKGTVPDDLADFLDKANPNVKSED